MNGKPYAVLLLDPSCGAVPEILFRTATRREAEAACAEWDNGDTLGLVAVVWPAWAPLPAGTTELRDETDA